MDESMYRLLAEFEERYWWFVAKNRIILGLVDRFAGHDLAPKTAHGRGTGTDGTRPKALDIGCGTGGLLAKLAERFDAVGTDMSPLAREFCARRGLTALDGSLPDKLPFDQPASFDVIVMSEVIEHVEDDAGSVATAVRLLRPGGLLVCTVPAHPWLWSAHDEVNHHFRRYTKRAFAALFEGHGGIGEGGLERLVLSYANAAMFPVLAAVRLAGNVRGRRGEDAASGKLRMPPRMVNAVLTEVFAAERFVLPRMGLPMGSSLVGVFRKQWA